MGWLKDFLESTDKTKLNEMLPGVRNVEEHSCCRCGTKGYVLPGLHLDLQNNRHQVLYLRYMKQKPLFCEKCRISFCQDCATRGLKAIDVTERARARIAQQMEEIVESTVGGHVIMPGFCLECGEPINYA
jgi:hypothetical protein